MSRWSCAAAIIVITTVSACSPGGRTAASASPTRAASVAARASQPEPETAAALVPIAQLFNDDYGSNKLGPVYDRWDLQSQALITRSDYLRRHTLCPTAPQSPTQVRSAAPGPGGAWLVRYEIDRMTFTDYWFYRAGQWTFDIILSNPESARQYRLAFADYVAAIGCRP